MELPFISRVSYAVAVLRLSLSHRLSIHPLFNPPPSFHYSPPLTLPLFTHLSLIPCTQFNIFTSPPPS